jgi:hypothetical protein
MNMNALSSARWLAGPEANLAFAWLWILAGFITGMAIGMFFHREGWLGGYGSHARRLLRLGHISFFGLAGINLMFYLTVRAAALAGPLTAHASWLLILGGATMPACCALMAWNPRWHLFFGVPVLSLIGGAALTFFGIIL